MRTIERNYRKNPHTASFLRTFHTGIGSNGRNYREELNVDENLAELELARTQAAQEADLLTLVPETTPAFTQSPAQVKFISDLVLAVNALDKTLGEQAASYTGRMDREGMWTRENTSRWIDNLKAKLAELREARNPIALATVANGRYAVEENGVLRFFKVKNGSGAGFVFLDVQASDEWHSIRNLGRIRAVLALIAADPKAAMIRYGQELGECGHCGRTLTDAASRAAGIGPICASK